MPQEATEDRIEVQIGDDGLDMSASGAAADEQTAKVKRKRVPNTWAVSTSTLTDRVFRLTTYLWLPYVILESGTAIFAFPRHISRRNLAARWPRRWR